MTRVKWNETNIERLKEMAKNGFSTQQIANEFGTTRIAITACCSKFKIKTIDSPKRWGKEELEMLNKLLEENKTVPLGIKK